MYILAAYGALTLYALGFFYVVRRTATYASATNLALTSFIAGVTVTLANIWMTNDSLALDIVGTFMISGIFIALRPAVFLFNISDNALSSAVRDSAQKLLMATSETGTDPRITVFSRGAEISLTLFSPLPKTSILRYTVTKESAKVDLFKRLLAKHFFRALPRITIKL